MYSYIVFKETFDLRPKYVVASYIFILRLRREDEGVTF